MGRVFKRVKKFFKPKTWQELNQKEYNKRNARRDKDQCRSSGRTH